LEWNGKADTYIKDLENYGGEGPGRKAEAFFIPVCKVER